MFKVKKETVITVGNNVKLIEECDYVNGLAGYSKIRLEGSRKDLEKLYWDMQESTDE